MFALDLFNNDHERHLSEGAVDQLEQRRIDDLAMKMDDLVARAKTATTPEVKAALVKEFQKCKAERDSYFKIKDECMGYGGLTAEAGIPGNVPADKIPGKEDLLKGKGRSYYEAGIPGSVPTEKIPGKEDLLKGKGRSYYEAQDQKKNSEVTEDQRLAVGDPVIVTAPNEFEGKTGEIAELSPSGKFVIVNLYNHGEQPMHLSDVEFNQYAADQEDEDDWYDDGAEDTLESNKYEPAPDLIDLGSIPGLNLGGSVKTKPRLGGGKSTGIQAPDKIKTRGQINNFKDRFLQKLKSTDVDEGFQDFNKVEPYAVCLAGKPVKKFDYYEQARRFHDNWKKKLYREGDKAKADTITLMPLNLDEAMNKNDLLGNVAKDLNTQFKKAKSGKLKASGDFTKGDHWQGAKPGDYGYTGYQGHGMPKDNPKKKKGVAEMDSQGYTGTRDDYEQDSKHKGPEGKGTPVTAKQMVGDLEKELNDKFNTPAGLQKDADYRAYRKGVKASRKQPPAPIKEFAPSPERDEDEVPDQILQLANRWWNATDDQPKITNVLRSLGWSIAQVESEDDAVQMQHDDGTTYFISADDFDPDVFEAQTDYSKRRQRERDVDAGKPVAKQRTSKMTDYQKRRAQDKKDMELGESHDDSGVEQAILHRIMVAHTDLLKQFGPQKVMQAAEEVAYNVGDVDEIGTSDVSAYVAQVRQILGA